MTNKEDYLVCVEDGQNKKIAENDLWNNKKKYFYD
jgi:hypothetical protein